jgi:hypothetical protein
MGTLDIQGRSVISWFLILLLLQSCDINTKEEVEVGEVFCSHFRGIANNPQQLSTIKKWGKKIIEEYPKDPYLFSSFLIRYKDIELKPDLPLETLGIDRNFAMFGFYELERDSKAKPSFITIGEGYRFQLVIPLDDKVNELPSYLDVSKFEKIGDTYLLCEI